MNIGMMVRDLTPDHAVLLLTLGVFLIYIELNRPGLVLPGSLGLLAVLVAFVPFLRRPPHSFVLLLLATAVLTFLRALRRETHPLFFAAATLCLIDGFLRIPVHLVIALACGLLLGLATTCLVRIARRARVNKGPA